MAGFVTSDLKEWSKQEVENVVIALSAEAGLPYQAAADKKDRDRIAAGVALIKDEDRCAQCHKFHDAGEVGSAPDLTGYGSQAWTEGMIGQPGAEKFYGENNDRMPAFAEHPAEPHKNILTPAQIGMLAEWLRSSPDGETSDSEVAAKSAAKE
jgi:ubiquinol-cytochrome c reductase cytochrome b subunit